MLSAPFRRTCQYLFHSWTALMRPVTDLRFHLADRRALARISDTALTRTDWAWRPHPWVSALPNPAIAPALSDTALGDTLKLFHDCPCAEISLRQVPDDDAADGPPYHVELAVARFAGQYLSLVIELPPEVCVGLRDTHLIGLTVARAQNRSGAINARLNIRHGPNIAQIMMPVPDCEGAALVEFDLAYAGLHIARTTQMWIDLMITNPAMTTLTLHDLSLARYPRAAF